MTVKPLLSIAICTYNRSDELAVTLSCLQNCLSVFEKGDEVLIVNNNSSDETQAVIERFTNACEGSALSVEYCFEEKQGLSAARNLALKKFVNEVIIFFDDDVSISADTINAYRSGINKYILCGFLGGRIVVDWCGSKPVWYRDDSLPLLNGLIGHYNLGDLEHLYQLGDLLAYGANFCVRRNLVEQVGYFNESLGVKGAEIGRGEETDYFERALQLGVQGVYLPNAEVGHRFQLERINVRYLYRYGVEKGRAVAHKMTVPRRGFALHSLLYLLRGTFQLLRNRPDRFYQCIINIGIERGLSLGSDHGASRL